MTRPSNKALSASLGEALSPPTKRKPARATDLTEYDDDVVAEETSTEAVAATPVVTPVTTPVQTPAETPVDTGVDTPVETKPAEMPRERIPYLDATHTPSEKSVYSVMYRETVSKGVTDRHFGFKELSQKTGIRSDKTVRVAIDGLLEKLSIEIIAYQHGSPLGPRYRVFDPKEIAKRRLAAGMEIDPQSKKIVKTPVGTGVGTGVSTGDRNDGRTPANMTPVTGVEDTGASLNIERGLNPNIDDDAALAGLVATLKELSVQLTGKEPTSKEVDRWRELAEVIATEGKIASARTPSVSSVPAFLAEHLRRRLFRKDKSELVEEGREAASPSQPQQLSAEQIAKCPDCGGSTWYYPEGYDRPVKKCRHEKLLNE